MRSVSLALAIVWMAGTSQGMPQYGRVPDSSGGSGSGGSKTPTKNPTNQPQTSLPAGCRFQFQDFHSIVEIETEEEVCTPFTANVCETKYRRVCEDEIYDICVPKYGEECETKYNEVEVEQFRDVLEPYVEEECNNKLIKACESHWVILANGDKVWEEDPTKCKEIPETTCEEVRKTRTKKEKYTDYKKVPYQDCRQVVQGQQCSKGTRPKCRENVPYQDCKDVIKNDCKIVHKKVPTPQTERRQVRVCDGGDVVIKSSLPEKLENADDDDDDDDDDVNEIIEDGIRSGSFEEEEDDDDDDDDGISFTFSRR